MGRITITPKAKLTVTTLVDVLITSAITVSSEDTSYNWTITSLELKPMKKNYIFLLINLSVIFGTFAQNVVRVYDFDVKMGHASDGARNFADYHNVERKSGAAILQSVSFLDGVTHRMIFAGDPANWGPKVEKSDAEWEAYLRKQQLHINSGGGSMVMTSLMWRMEGDFEKCKTSRYWEIIPEEPEKYIKAREKFVNSIGDILEWRIMGLSSIDMGGSGGTHTSLMLSLIHISEPTRPY